VRKVMQLRRAVQLQQTQLLQRMLRAPKPVCSSRWWCHQLQQPRRQRKQVRVCTKWRLQQLGVVMWRWRCCRGGLWCLAQRQLQLGKV
jgi:hypothetical protein